MDMGTIAVTKDLGHDSLWCKLLKTLLKLLYHLAICDIGNILWNFSRAVWIIFLLTSVLMVITVAHMVIGVLVQRAICEPLKNPQDNRMFALVDEIVQIKNKLYPQNPNADVNMSYIIT